MNTTGPRAGGTNRRRLGHALVMAAMLVPAMFTLEGLAILIGQLRDLALDGVWHPLSLCAALAPLAALRCTGTGGLAHHILALPAAAALLAAGVIGGILLFLAARWLLERAGLFAD